MLLSKAGCRPAMSLFFSDEARVGLHGSNRRVWGVRSIKVVQLVQIRRQWKYLFAAVNPITGALYWTWIDSMSKEHTIEALSEIRESKRPWDAGLGRSRQPSEQGSSGDQRHKLYCPTSILT